MNDESFHNPESDHLEEHRCILARLAALETKVENFTSTSKKMEKMPLCAGQDDDKFKFLMGKLEEIRYCIIDVESECARHSAQHRRT